jgi:ATP-dependent exoDNAse (exonuclease V) beta subunit
MSSLYIYKSAAGSGKTHVLVRAYLQLALQSPDNFRRILAVTFTNQATKEMKQRILTSLNSMAQGIDIPLTQELLGLNKWDKNTLQTRAQLVRSQILHHYDHFKVSTIDSFFQTIIRSFAKELGIPPGFNVQLQQESVLDEVIEKVIGSANYNTKLQKWLITFAKHKLLSGKSWHFKKELGTLGAELFKEVFSLQEAELMHAISNQTDLNSFLVTLDRIILDFENSLQALGQKSIEFIQKAQLSVADFAYGQIGVAGYLSNLQQNKKFTPTKRAINAAENSSAWSTKSSPNKQAITEVVENGLQDLLRQVIGFYQSHYRPYYTALAIQEFVHALGIMTHLKEKLQDYRANNQVMLVSDATNLIRQVIDENDTPFIYEKIGTHYKHFLMDEFQDISGFQWKNIKPLINNSLAEGYNSLLVGDVKQSIYRWRGGNWRLLLSQLEKEIGNTKTTSLYYNWRSKQHIIDFNNTFFTEASLILTQHLQAEIEEITEPELRQTLLEQVKDLATAYQDVYQQIPHHRSPENPGYVQVTLFQDQETATGETISWKDQVKQQLPSLIESLQDEGFALEDIALLVRNNAEGRELFQTLLTYQHSNLAKPGYRYEAISVESLYLGNNPWINILINALRYLANKKDEIAEAELTYFYQCYVCEINHPSVVYHHWQSSAIQQQSESQNPLLPERFLNEQINLQQLPLYERIAALISIFQLQRADMVPFIQAFQDAVLQYLKRESAEIQHFLVWWNTQGSQLSLPRMEGQEAMSIMTIHQAKGLQFKVVILPFCEWYFDHNPKMSPIIWCPSSIAPFSDFPILPLRYNKSLKDTIYINAYYEERMQTYLDNLNLLYVAFTRPEDRLYVFAHHPSKPALKSTAELLYQIFTQEEQLHTNKEDTLKTYLTWKQHWDTATNTLTLGKPEPVVRTTSQTDLGHAAPLLSNPWRDRLTDEPSFSPVGNQATVSNVQARQIQLITTILTNLQHENQLQSSLAALQVEHGLSQAERDDLQQYIASLWENPTIRAWYEGSWIVQRHASILAPTGQVYQPQRIMTQKQSAVLVDFLTHANAYNQACKQLQETAALLVNMDYISVQVYLLDIRTKILHHFPFEKK